MSAPTSAPTSATVQKRTKLERVFKAAGRLPRFPAINLKPGFRNGIGIGKSRNPSPSPGETPVVLLKLQVLGCSNLPAKGSINPFVVVSLLNKKSTTPVSKRTADPVYAAQDNTFDFPIYLSFADRLGVVELVVWDKQTLTKEYLGEVSIPLEDWFGKVEDGKDKERMLGFDQPGNLPFSLDLVSTRVNMKTTGSIQVKLGFAPAPDADSLNSVGFEEVYAELLRRKRPSLISAPPTEGVGTIRSRPGPPVPIQYEDDGGISSDSDSVDENKNVADISFPAAKSAPKPLLDMYTPPSTSTSATGSTSTASDPEPSTTSVSKLELKPKPKAAQRRVALPSTPFRLPMPATELNGSPVSPTSNNLPTLTPVTRELKDPPTTVTSASALSSASPSIATRFIPKTFLRKFSGLTTVGVRVGPKAQSQESASPTSVDSDAVRRDDVALTSTPLLLPVPASPKPANDVPKHIVNGVGVGAGLSVSGVGPSVDLAAAAATAGGGGTKWKSDWESKHANGIIGVVVLEVEGADDLPEWPNATHTGWDMDPFVVVAFSKKVFRTRVIRHSLNPVFDEKLFFHVRRSETGFRVQLTVLDWDKLSANDLVGDATFGVKELIDDVAKPDEETGLYAVGDGDERDREKTMREFRLELATVKDLPGGVKPVIRFRAQYHPYDELRQRFWRHYLAQYDTDNTSTLSRLELTAILDSLGSTLSRSTVSSFFTRYGKDPKIDEISVNQAVICLEERLVHPPEDLNEREVDDVAATSTAEPVVMIVGDHGEEVKLDLDLSFGGLHFSGPPHVVLNGAVHSTQPMQMLLEHAASGVGGAAGIVNENGRAGNDDSEIQATPPSTPGQVQRVVNVHNCPFCHRPRLDSKSAIDVVTHIALCASQDWTKVDRIMVGNFVTASEAERKWYVQVIMDVAAGEYRLGANSANIIVQNRTTGLLEEEKMQVYVRLGIRLLYKGFLSEMESEGAHRLLKALSIKQGMKYDDLESVKEIPNFIEFHGLNVDELLDPLDSFKTFNQFFYRKLKPSARPIDSPDDPYRLVSGADCRLLTFETVSHATRLWIKGGEFSVARLLGEAYKDDVERYTGGALAIFRLAPQDYHRFHSPVEGKIGKMTYIAGEYYTVNPQAIRTALDVYGENARKIVPIHSPQFGQVMAVCIGAMMVGSIRTTVEEGEYVKRGQEFGYFAFGGSTIVFLFEKGRVNWDDDLLTNGRRCLESLVRVGMGIGRGRRVDG